MKRAFVDVKGILLIMKITNRRSTHANSMMCVFQCSLSLTSFSSSLFLSNSPSVTNPQTDKVCLHFHFLIRTLLSQREPLLTGTQTLAGLYEFLH